ncbi:biotin-dependent carboxyltransferase family protein [Jannaschia aquimarina]|uniref:KipA protein n=1 Tax=Jannaschia aquimarina TaxID=935700 RepID=A0A0D1EHF8_9RHOB|nr:biotin-dependent carboxyltransferase family protein [Jannaschia aquimarina]KIT15255.1 KipI antagonist [Jannaschia aquimarina]SNT32184.1 Allophanate hydrolase subunit 2 [Jannaschia aquimarina]
MIVLRSCGPLVTHQGDGHPGHMGDGLSRAGFADVRARQEAAALLGVAPEEVGALETPGSPLEIACEEAVTLAFVGAPMEVAAEGRPVPWHASRRVGAGEVLRFRPLGQGVYSYIAAIGLTGPDGTDSAHLTAGIGRALESGDRLSVEDRAQPPERRLTAAPDRFGGGVLRCVPTPQTSLFGDEVARFEAVSFTRDRRGNRQGIRLDGEGGFATEKQLTLLSDFVLTGDVQMTGDGVPYILGPECQTTGGYPRIAHVIAADQPRAFQAPPGAPLSFRFVSLEDARAARPRSPGVEPLVRDPRDIPDLGRYQLIDGITDGRGDEGRS